MDRRDTGVGWVVAKAEIKKQDDTMVEFGVAMTSTWITTKGQYSTIYNA